MKNHKIYKMTFSSIYPMYVNKVVRKDKNVEDLDIILIWLTGYNQNQLDKLKESEDTLEEFFDNAPMINPNTNLITGLICGIRVEDIEEDLMQKIRYMDKLVDELAKGKSMDKILRKSSTTLFFLMIN